MIMTMEMETMREVAKAETARRAISLFGPMGRMERLESLTGSAADVMGVSSMRRLSMSSCYR